MGTDYDPYPLFILLCDHFPDPDPPFSDPDPKFLTRYYLYI